MRDSDSFEILKRYVDIRDFMNNFRKMLRNGSRMAVRKKFRTFNPPMVEPFLMTYWPGEGGGGCHPLLKS